MANQVFVHFPDPAEPRIVTCWLTTAPLRGDEFPEGFTVTNHKLITGDHGGKMYEYEVWVEPRPKPDEPVTPL
jgi:hypothetical protein